MVRWYSIIRRKPEPCRDGPYAGKSGRKLSVVILGLVPRTHFSARFGDAIARQRQQRRIAIRPMWVVTLDQIDLPLPDMMLQRFFSLNRRLDGGEWLVVHEQFRTVAAREFRAAAFTMGFDAGKEIVRHAEFKRAVGFAREDLDPGGEPRHRRALHHRRSLLHDGSSGQARG